MGGRLKHMRTLAVSTLTQALSDLLIEAYAGPPDPSRTWFIDNRPDCGIQSEIKNITAAEASRSVDGSGTSGSTIAANTEHLRWSLANANRALRGEQYQPNWNESWALIEADEAKWNALREALRSEYERLLDAVKQKQDLSEDELLDTMALVPHAAFHLGILRQMIERVRQD
jgi:hypothetical protein